MKTIVIYKSKTGFAKTYAKWISEALQCEMMTFDHIKKVDLQTYDLIIYGAGVMAGKMYELDKFKSYMNVHQKIVLFATGAISLQANEIIEKLKLNSLERLGRTVPFYYYQAGLSYEKMGFLTKKMIQTFYKSLLKKQERTNEEEEMVKVMGESHTYAKPEDIQDMIQNIKQGQ